MTPKSITDYSFLVTVLPCYCKSQHTSLLSFLTLITKNTLVTKQDLRQSAFANFVMEHES